MILYKKNHIWGISFRVKIDTDFEKDTRKRISERSRIVLLDFKVNGVVFREIFIVPA